MLRLSVIGYFSTIFIGCYCKRSGVFSRHTTMVCCPVHEPRIFRMPPMADSVSNLRYRACCGVCHSRIFRLLPCEKRATALVWRKKTLLRASVFVPRFNPARFCAVCSVPGSSGSFLVTILFILCLSYFSAFVYDTMVADTLYQQPFGKPITYIQQDNHGKSQWQIFLKP